MKDSPKKLAERSAKRKAGSMYEVYDKRSFLPLARKLIVDHRAWLETEDLIAALEANSREPIPSPVLKHLRQRLDGVAKKQRGRKANTDATSLIRGHLVPIRYERYLSWLQKRDRTQGLAGWSCIRTSPWWQGPPNERAARMVQASLMRHVDWRHVMNLVSKSRS